MDAETTETNSRLRQAALAELLVVLPFVLLGIVLTLSLYGIYFGVPLLAVTVPIVLVVRDVRREPGDPGARRRLAIASAFVAVVFSAALVGLVFVGLDDVDSFGDAAWVGVGVIWTAAAWVVAVICSREANSG
jgi:hypothetical protein